MEHLGNEFTAIFNLTDAANSGKIMMCVLSEDKDVFSYCYVGCVERRWSSRCRWSGGICQCWASFALVIMCRDVAPTVMF